MKPLMPAFPTPLKPGHPTIRQRLVALGLDRADIDEAFHATLDEVERLGAEADDFEADRDAARRERDEWRAALECQRDAMKCLVDDLNEAHERLAAYEKT